LQQEQGQAGKQQDEQGHDEKPQQQKQKDINHENEDGDRLSLEWLRSAPDDRVAEFLMSVAGLGRKSTE
jgi:hypothetical protein